MAQRRFHYEQAFEAYLRANRIPYIAVDEARKSLLPADQPLPALKSFDFVVYGPDGINRLIDVKGRLFKGGRRLESWVTLDDIDGLGYWEQLFGSAFRAAFVFIYCLQDQPPDALFEQVFTYSDRWYVLREIELASYRRDMVPRSAKWRTVHLSSSSFQQRSRPFEPHLAGFAAECAHAGC